MAPLHILRIPRADEGSGFILCEVRSNGSKPLDARILATEGEAIYAGKLRHDRVGDLKDGKSACTGEEWESIVISVLLGGEVIEDIEAAATVHDAHTIDIAIRRRIAGITQRLGTLTLRQTDHEEVQLFDWCGLVALERNKTKEDLATATARNQKLEAQNSKLKDQLEELVQAKEKNESDLLRGFRDLLNEKKLSVRKLQRLLASAKIDPAAVSAAQTSAQSESSSSRKARAPKGAKRKAIQAESSEEDPEDGFEDVKGADQHHPSESESADQVTPDDDETGSEPEVGDEDEPMPDARPDPGRQRTLPPRQGQDGPASHTRSSQKAEEAEQVQHMPPKRALPFSKPKPAAAAHRDAEGSETSSGDDEEL